MNYFSLLCFSWAVIGIGSRIIMGIMGEKWKSWELNTAYAPQRPMIINVIAITGIAVVIYTWFKVITTEVNSSWIVALLISFTVIKVATVLFRYEKFRAFAFTMLNDKRKMLVLNLGVVAYSVILVLMGYFLYN